jgi:glycosyltransferase 2 family protein
MSSRIIRLLQPLFAGLALLSIAYIVSSQWESLRAYPWRFHGGWLALASLLLVGTWLLEVVIWRELLLQVGGRLSYHAAVRTWFLSSIVRYVPGNIWQPISMTLYCRERGVRPEATLTSIALFQLLTLLAVVPVATVYVIAAQPLSILGALSSGPGLVLLGVMFAPVVILVARPRWLLEILNWLLHKAGRNRLDITISSRRLLLLISAMTIVWLLWGVTFAAFAFSLASYTVAAQVALAPHLIAAYPMAYAVGVLSLITPSGFGVREGAFYFLLAPYSDGAAITVIALGMRLFTLAGELLLAGVSALWHDQRVSPPLSDDPFGAVQPAAVPVRLAVDTAPMEVIAEAELTTKPT